MAVKGLTPLLMNKFNESELQSKVRDKNLTPREEAEKVLYAHTDGRLYLPTTMVYACLINAGKFHKLGKNKVTTQKSSLIPAGVMINEQATFFPKGTKWEVDSRPVVIPSTGGRIMKHRPRLDEWELKFSFSLDTTMFSPKFLRMLVDDAGSKVGLGDFRPERKGFYGRFVVTEWTEQ